MTTQRSKFLSLKRLLRLIKIPTYLNRIYFTSRLKTQKMIPLDYPQFPSVLPISSFLRHFTTSASKSCPLLLWMLPSVYSQNCELYIERPITAIYADIHDELSI